MNSNELTRSQSEDSFFEIEKKYAHLRSRIGEETFRSLLEIESAYSAKIAEFVLRVILGEMKKSDPTTKRRNVLEKDEIINISFLVLENCKRHYREREGKTFENYALRSLKNELWREKRNRDKNLFYYDYEELTESAYEIKQPPSTENPFVYQESEAIDSEKSFLTSERLRTFLKILIVSMTELTSLEKSILYYSFFVSNSKERTNLKPLSKKTNLSYHKLLSILKMSLEKIQKRIQ